MRHRPDLLWVLVVVFGLGMVTTCYAQSQWRHDSAAASVAEPEIARR